MLMSRNKSGQLDAAAEGSTRIVTVHAQKLASASFWTVPLFVWQGHSPWCWAGTKSVVLSR